MKYMLGKAKYFWIMALILMIQISQITAQVDTGGKANTSHHNKEIVGYITNWDAWKESAAGLPAQGALTHLNIDYSKYTILNFSFFGVAVDGSLHSGDYRNKQIYKKGVVQEPADIFYTDVYSSWDMHILFGEIEPIHYINQDVVTRAAKQGFKVQVGGNTWSHPVWGLDGPLPIPLHKETGAPGLLELAHQKGVQVMASIGGWSMCKHFPEMAADATKRKRFVDDCVRLINIGFDGIDLDWEYPGPYSGMNFTGSEVDFANFVTLVQEIRAAIGPTKLISAAFSADPKKIDGFDWAALNETMDLFNMMTYDFNGGWSDIAGHNSPLRSYTGAEIPQLNWQSSLDKLVQLGVNLNKTNFGMPFYGRGVNVNGNATLNGPTVKRPEMIDPDGPIDTCADYTNWPKGVYDGTPNYFFTKQKALGSWTRHWDNEASMPYLTNGKFFLSYDDQESLAAKAQFINNNDLSGAIVWTVYGDLEFSGGYTSFGSKLKRWSTVKSDLINRVNEVFAEGPHPAKEIATDDLETYGWKGGKGAWGGPWKKTGIVKKNTKKPYSGKKYARFLKKATLERVVDLSGTNNPKLRFASRMRSFEKGDQAVIKVSADGVTYTEAMVLTSDQSDNIYAIKEIPLSGYQTSNRFHILFEAQTNSNKDYWYIDKIELIDE